MGKEAELVLVSDLGDLVHAGTPQPNRTKMQEEGHSCPPAGETLYGEEDKSHSLHRASHRPATAQIPAGHYSAPTLVMRTALWHNGCDF